MCDARVCSPTAGGAVGYANLYKKSGLDSEAVAVYNHIVDMVPRNLLRHRLLSMAAGPEAFLVLRNQVCVGVGWLALCTVRYRC